jgi:S1-C subfamily serine protease
VTSNVLAELSAALRDLVQRASPSVVGLEHRRGQGSGVVLAADGYVLTNAHVARRSNELTVRVADGARARGRLVGADEATDLAVVRIDAADLVPLPLLDTNTLGVGEIVVAIGNPFGFERSVSWGVVSAMYRDLPAGRDTVLAGLIQTDAAVNPGNSGGPLVDTTGRVAGITTAMIPYAHGLSFAVPARTASWVAAVLIQHGAVRRPYLGVRARAEELDARYEQRRAVRIVGIEADTPADRAGLQPGDLLLRADGHPVHTLDDLHRAMVLSASPSIAVEVLRGDDRHRLEIRPQPKAA